MSTNIPEIQARRTPLPKLQLSILLYIQLAEPITSTVIYPFVNQLVRETGITKGDEKKTGYYAGLIESLFYATEAISVLQWGRASDRIGRKPVMLGGLFGLTISMIGFGLSKTFWALVLSRCAQGALNGNIGVTKSMMAEITDPSNMAQGFAYLPLVWSTGSTLGPIIGGVLSLPANRWPNCAGFLKKYPYLLPCMVTASISVSAAILTAFFLKETLPNAIGWNIKKRQIKPPRSSDPSVEEAIHMNLLASDPIGLRANFTEYDPHSKYTPQPLSFCSNTQASIAKPLPLRSLLISRVLYPILNYAFLAFIDQCFTVLLPLICSTSIPLGGLGFSSLNIGIIMGVWGVISGFVQIFAFANIMRKLGARRLYIISFACYLGCIGAFPLESLLVKRAGKVDEKVWAVIVIQMVFYMMAYMCYGCIFIYVSDGAPSKAALGATNGLAQTTASTMRALAPSTASSLFSLSLERNLAGGTLVYWILWVIIGAGIWASFRLPKKLLSQKG